MFLVFNLWLLYSFLCAIRFFNTIYVYYFVYGDVTTNIS